MHGDDGRRFVNDTWGGKDFTTKFAEGVTVGIGMEFSVPVAGPAAGKLMAFFLRDFRGVWFRANCFRAC